MNSHFDDFTKYKLLSKSEEKDETFKYYIEYYLDLVNHCQVKRTLKYRIIKVPRNKEQAIQERRKWEHFGNKNKDTTTTCDDVWMEYNPELLKSKKSTAYLYKNSIDKKEEIHVFEGYEKILEDKLHIMNINQSSNKYLEHLKKISQIKEKSSKKKIEIKSTGYIAPHIRNNKSQPKSKDDKISVRLSNFMPDTTEDEIKEWLKLFRLPTYKIYFPRNSDNSIKDFLYLNLQLSEDIPIVIDIINGQKMSYSIISASSSKKNKRIF